MGLPFVGQLSFAGQLPGVDPLGECGQCADPGVGAVEHLAELLVALSVTLKRAVFDRLTREGPFSTSVQDLDL